MKVIDGFALDYRVAVLFELKDMIIPKEEAHEKIIKRLEKMKISLDNKISDLIAIVYTHGKKQWSGHAKIHLKLTQEDGTKDGTSRVMTYYNMSFRKNL